MATASRNWDSDFRLREMDDDGVAAEILFPNTIPPFFPNDVDAALDEVRWGGSNKAASAASWCRRVNRRRERGPALPHPHEEGTTPDSKVAIQWTFTDRTAEETAKMLGLNVAQMYGFDVDALRPVAERPGPDDPELTSRRTTRINVSSLAIRE